MELIKVSKNDTELKHRSRFKNAEREEQILFTNNSETVMNSYAVGNEGWIDFSKLSLQDVGYKKTDGRIDLFSLTSKGGIVLTEFKARKSLKMLPQSLSYMTWVLSKQDSVRAYVDYQKEKGFFNKDIELNFNIKPKIVLVAEEFDKYDTMAAGCIRDDIEVFFKGYELFAGNQEKYLHVFDAMNMPWIINAAKQFGDTQSQMESENIGTLNGFYVEKNGILTKAKKKPLKELPQSIESIVQSEDKKLFSLSKIQRNVQTDNGIITAIGIEDNDRLSLIMHLENDDEIINYTLKQAEWALNKKPTVNGNPVNWNRKDHRLILVCDRNLKESEKDTIERLESERGIILDNFNFEPRWLSHYEIGDDNYLIIGKTHLHNIGQKSVYSMGYYTREFRENQELITTFNHLRSEILKSAKKDNKNVLESFYNKRGVTYSTSRQFVILEPNKNYISVKVFPSKERVQVFKHDDIPNAIEKIKQAYEDK
ncbi:MAG: hypothetical protein ABIB43_01590 [archaeon]